MRLTFKLVDCIKQFILPNEDGPQLKTSIEQKDGEERTCSA